MNYYIQGNTANADKIKDAFEKLGCDTNGWKFNAEGGFYYTHDGRIDLACGKFLINLIKTHPDYKELKLPIQPKFKVGDWIVFNGLTIYIKEIVKGYYITISKGGITNSYDWYIDNLARLWTIQDAKDGDVLSYQGEVFITRIARGLSANVAIDYDCCYDGNSFILDSFYSLTMDELKEVYPATKQQRDLLFAKMKEAGYKWDADKKELRKIKPHYDISKFYAGMPVLVRDKDNRKWCYLLYSHYDNTYEDGLCFNAGSVEWRQCTPFEGNEHLLGTTGPCDERFINW